ncbi:MAG TPA: c-type cytochrome [Pyrinomonadaceae bacterium]
MNRSFTRVLKLALALGCALVIFALTLSGRAAAGLSASAQATPTPTPAAPTQTSAPQASASFDQAKALSDLRARIAGQETKPAAEVFKNIQILKTVPAGRLLAVMEVGYSRSLGVDCTHCHLPGEWEKDDKATKGVAREMITMMRAINEEHLKKIKNLRSETPVVNCTTCHRGQTKPALNLPDARPRQ